MKKIILAFLAILLSTSFVYAGDVYVDGYYRKNGTYVKPHIRSSPDGKKWNNYGPKDSNDFNGNDILNDPKFRDNDDDGSPNYLDKDDDNDNILDDDDSSQYDK